MAAPMRVLAIGPRRARHIAIWLVLLGLFALQLRSPAPKPAPAIQWVLLSQAAPLPGRRQMRFDTTGESVACVARQKRAGRPGC